MSSKIAAGEVIERPASAVKELVENALDAGATRIRVELRGGGVDYIRVTDDGAGIPADQVELAFRRFATSKLERAEDLQSVSTLGFRGEALPSIAATARVELRSRARDSDVGTAIEIEDGVVQSIGSAGAPRGTTVAVSGLFRRLPARRRFLSSASAEQSHIHVVVAHYALAYPEVRFELNADRGRSFASAGSGELRDAVAAVYGRKIADEMLDLTPDAGDDIEPMVWGLIGPPSMDRANRRYISLFANRRWVRNRSLSYAIEQAYHGFIAERRYPTAVVNVSVPFEEVDVNAHPAKAEIRFRRENRVFGLLQRAVRKTLLDHAPIPEVSVRAVSRPTGVSAPASGAGGSAGGAHPPNPSSFWRTTPFGAHPAASADPSHSFIEPDESARAAVSAPPAVTPRGALPILRVLGQVQLTYIVAEGPDGMYLIDQHAAHERVMFERVMAQTTAGESESQSLLEPLVVELDDAKLELLTAQGETIAGMGFVVERFGGNAVIVRGAPALLRESDQSGALADVLDLMQDGGGFETWEERAAYSIACHAAIRAGKPMTLTEMQELIRQLEDCVQPNTCPHGRPTLIHMSAGQLGREFGRT